MTNQEEEADRRNARQFRLTQVTDPTGTYQFTFDNMGRLTGATTSYTFLTARNFTVGYSYDAASNRTGFTDPENGSTAYVYDTLNRLQTLTPPSGGWHRDSTSPTKITARK